MKKCLSMILCLILLLCGTTSALAAGRNWNALAPLPSAQKIRDFHATTRAPYVVMDPELPSGGFIEYAVDFRADYLPNGTYLCPFNWTFDVSSLKKQYAKVELQGVSGYCGFQVTDDGRRQAILTLWDVTCTDSRGRTTVIQPKMVSTAPGAKTENFTGDWITGEGNFTHSLIPYDWQAGRTYRLVMQLGQADNGNTSVLMYVYDLAAGIWTYLAEYDTGMKDVWFNWGCAFLEDFSWPNDPSIRTMELSNVRVHPRGKNSWQSIRKATFRTCFDHKGSYIYGADSDTFWCLTTGVENCWKNPAENKRVSVSQGSAQCPY